MTQKSSVHLLGCLTAWFFAGPLAVVLGAASSSRSNIVFFLADDLGQRDIGVYGSTFYETPNIDRLGREGALFTDAYAACPVCSPTRASILTGQWPQRTGITDYIAPDQGDRGTVFAEPRLLSDPESYGPDGPPGNVAAKAAPKKAPK